MREHPPLPLVRVRSAFQFPVWLYRRKGKPPDKQRVLSDLSDINPRRQPAQGVG